MRLKAAEKVFVFLLFAAMYMLYRLMFPNTVYKLKLPFPERPRAAVKAHDKDCPLKEAELRPPAVMKIALASYPGSGVMWVRQLIEQVTGIATGSVYCDQKNEDMFPGECIDDDTVLTIRTHEWYDKWKYHKAVILIRSPFKSFGSYFRQRLDIQEPTALDYELEFKSFIDKLLPNWKWYNQEWMRDFTSPKYVLFYDNLKKDLAGEMRKLMKFLEVPYSEKDFKCMLKNFDIERPSRQKIDIRRYFSPLQLEETEKNITFIEKMAETVIGEYHKIDRDL